MRELYPLRIDAFAHIAPEKYRKALEKEAPDLCRYMIDPVGPLYDLEHRFRLMDRYEGLVQIIVPSWPSVEFAAPGKAVDLAKITNDEMANLVLKYPERFVAGVACLPMNDVDAALKEAERAIDQLRFRGVLIYTPINDRPLDSPEFMPLYEMMAQYDLPILIHPMRAPDYPDYRTESESKYRVYMTFGWPYETTIAMTRIVFSGILEKYPNLKFVTHHCGGMVTFFEERIKQFYDIADRRREIFNKDLRKAPIDYYKMFYNDTAIYGNTAGLMVGYGFAGPDHLLFGVDFPLGDMDFGNRNYRQTINAIERMDISDEDRRKIYQGNAKKIFRLPI
ncbi:MAG: amidohydrolase [Desulfobacteraceae bacterium]|nr:MAG: amidohydrolase [Desulfobacteraceae bacterium]